MEKGGRADGKEELYVEEGKPFLFGVVVVLHISSASLTIYFETYCTSYIDVSSLNSQIEGRKIVFILSDVFGSSISEFRSKFLIIGWHCQYKCESLFLYQINYYQYVSSTHHSPDSHKQDRRMAIDYCLCFTLKNINKTIKAQPIY